MLFKKQEFPEEGELVLCTVTSVQFHSVFCDLDEYTRGGMIHISEVSPGRIRNIRDFVKEGKKVVCKVLRINKEKGYIDLSLRRVNESEKKRKIDAIKREQNAEKIIEIAAHKSGVKTEDLFKEISPKAMEKYLTLYELFEAASKDGSILQDLGIDKKYLEFLGETINQRIKPSQVEIKGKMKITTYASNGIDAIKESLKKAKEIGDNSINIYYLGSGTYRFVVIAPDYKEAEKILKNSTESAMEIVSKQQGTAEFVRDAD